MANITHITKESSGRSSDQFIASLTQSDTQEYSFKETERLSRIRHANSTRTESSLGDSQKFERNANPTIIHDFQSELSEPTKTLPDALSTRFNVLEPLSISGQATVYLVEEKANGNQAVVKLYSLGTAPNTVVMDNLLNYPSDHYVRLMESGWVNDRYYELIDFISGATLRKVLDDSLLDIEQRKEVFKRLLSAVMFLHETPPNGPAVIHRDVKPENYMLRDIDSSSGVLLDFGISSPLKSPDLGEGRQFTLRYAAPEALEGKVSTALDYWSLGIVALELVSGENPFDGFEDDFIEALLTDKWPVSLPSYLTGYWRTLCEGLLERDPATRWGADQIQRWIENAEHDEEIVREVSSDKILYVGETACSSLEELAAALYSDIDWANGIVLAESGELYQWIRGNYPNSEVVQALEELQQQPGSAALQVLRVIYLIQPKYDPAWLGRKMTQSNLALITEKAGNGDALGELLVQQLYAQNVLYEIGTVSQRSDYVALHNRWISLAEEFDNAWQEVQRLGVMSQLQPTRSALLATFLYLSIDQNSQSSYAQRSREIVQRQQVPVLWLNMLNHGAGSDSIANQLLICLLEDDLLGNARTDLAIESVPTDTERLVGEEVFRRDRAQRSELVSCDLEAYYWDVFFTYQGHRFVIGRHVNLRWSSSNARWVYLQGYGRLDQQGSLNFTLNQSETFRLTARGPGGRVILELSEIPFVAPTLQRGLNGKDLRPALVGSDLRRGLRNNDIQRGLTTIDLRRGLKKHDLRNELTNSDIRKQLRKDDLRDGLTVNDMHKTMTIKDLRVGLTSNDLRNGLTGKDLPCSQNGKKKGHHFFDWLDKIRSRIH